MLGKQVGTDITAETGGVNIFMNEPQFGVRKITNSDLLFRNCVMSIAIR